MRGPDRGAPNAFESESTHTFYAIVGGGGAGEWSGLVLVNDDTFAEWFIVLICIYYL